MLRELICTSVWIGLLWLPMANAGESGAKWLDSFGVNEKNLRPAGSNRYFIIEPGYKLVFEGKEDDATVRLTIAVLDETKKVDGVETRVVEERETRNGKLAEVSRVGDRYFQEVAPGTAMDRAEVVSTNEMVSTPAGIFVHCVKTEETMPLEPKSEEYKYYAPRWV